MQRTIQIIITLAFTLSFAFMLFMGCNDRKQDHSKSQQISYDVWQYPIQLGDSRAKVHKLLGSATRTTPQLEEYPLSGVSISFDGMAKVIKLWFAGPGCSVYSDNDGIQNNPLPTEHLIFFDLTGSTNEARFRQAFGVPQRESQEGSAAKRELHCIWRYQGYLVDALFLFAERNQGDKIFAKGTLVWLEVSRAI